MKGGMIMNRFRFLLLTAFIVAVSVLSWGTSVTFANQDSAAPHKATEKEIAAKKRADADAPRARAQRDAAIKQRAEGRKYIQKMIKGQQPAPAAEPDKAGKEDAK
jgi:hypothetical protein